MDCLWEKIGGKVLDDIFVRATETRSAELVLYSGNFTKEKIVAEILGNY